MVLVGDQEFSVQQVSDCGKLIAYNYSNNNCTATVAHKSYSKQRVWFPLFMGCFLRVRGHASL